MIGTTNLIAELNENQLGFRLGQEARVNESDQLPDQPIEIALGDLHDQRVCLAAVQIAGKTRVTARRDGGLRYSLGIALSGS